MKGNSCAQNEQKTNRPHKKKATKDTSQYDMNQRLAEHEMRLAWNATCDPDRTYHEQQSRRARARARRELSWEEKEAQNDEWYAQKAAEEEAYRQRDEKQRKQRVRDENEGIRIEEHRRYEEQREEQRRRH
jgi:hypothetical protein